MVLLLFLLLAFAAPFETQVINFDSEIVQKIAGLKVESALCQQHLLEYATALSKFEIWALQMFDATSKIQPGLMKGNTFDLGDFDECLDVNKTFADSSLMGKHCVGTMNALELSWRWSFCIPDSCSPEEAAPLLELFFAAYGFNGKILPYNGKYICQTKKDITQPLDTGAIIAVTFFSIIIACMVIDTIYDVYLHYTDKKPYHELLTSFSVFSNGKKLFRIVKSEKQINCIDGLRVFSMMWIVYSHRAGGIIGVGAITNLMDVLKWADKPHSMIMTNGALAVDTFFLIGGCMVSYGFMCAMAKGIPFNIPKFYIHRYLRITIPLAAVVLIAVTILPYASDGADYQEFVRTENLPCEKYWWSTLLHIQNWVNPGYDQMCVGQTWYLSVDMQLFLISPLLLLPLKRWPKRTLAATGALILASMATVFYLANKYGFSAINNTTAAGDGRGWDYYYVQPHTRGSVWLIGFILGYFVYKIKNKEIEFKPNIFVVITMWIVCFVLLLTCIFAGFTTLRGPEFNKMGNTLHMTFIKPVWGIALSILVIACCSGYGGPINAFLSLPIFQIYNRLTYAIYLLHIHLMNGSIYARRVNYYFSDYNAEFIFWGDWMFSSFIAIWWALAFEFPIVTLEKYLFAICDCKKNKTNEKSSKEEV